MCVYENKQVYLIFFLLGLDLVIYFMNQIGLGKNFLLKLIILFIKLFNFSLRK